MRENKILHVAKEVIEFEIEALKNLKKKINLSFSKVVKTILGCKNGKVIISGVGKSGIIAKKWAATFHQQAHLLFY